MKKFKCDWKSSREISTLSLNFYFLNFSRRDDKMIVNNYIKIWIYLNINIFKYDHKIYAHLMMPES